jgi:predicted esterase
MIEERHIPISIQASYSVLNAHNANTKRVWLVFHGYGQLSKFFIKKFEELNPQENYIIAPQGLSKFYLEGFTGRVGASWMTKVDRLAEIAQQMNLVDEILKKEGVQRQNIQFNYFGFSQGVATMCRYAAHAKLPFGQMVLWAGTFPPELEKADFDFLKGDEQVKYYSGSDDPFYKEGMKEKQEELVLAAMGLTPTLFPFEGKHEVVASLVGKL